MIILTFCSAEKSFLAFRDKQQTFLVELIAGLGRQRHQFLLIVSHLFRDSRAAQTRTNIHWIAHTAALWQKDPPLHYSQLHTRFSIWHLISGIVNGETRRCFSHYMTYFVIRALSWWMVEENILCVHGFILVTMDWMYIFRPQRATVMWKLGKVTEAGN